MSYVQQEAAVFRGHCSSGEYDVHQTFFVELKIMNRYVYLQHQIPRAVFRLHSKVSGRCQEILVCWFVQCGPDRRKVFISLTIMAWSCTTKSINKFILSEKIVDILNGYRAGYSKVEGDAAVAGLRREIDYSSDQINVKLATFLREQPNEWASSLLTFILLLLTMGAFLFEIVLSILAMAVRKILWK